MIALRPTNVSTILLAALFVAACGGKGHGPDDGAPSDVYPAAHAALPQILKASASGSVASSPLLVTVTYANDPNRAAFDDLGAKMAASSYWPAVTAEYGVGAATTAVVHRTDDAPATLSDSAIEPELASFLDGTHPEWPANAPGVIYVLYYPAGTTISGQGTACQDYLAYHSSFRLAGQDVAYAIVPDCGAFDGYTALEQETISASHEIVEAVTDPYLDGYNVLDSNIWLMTGGSEVGDLCAGVSGYGIRPADIGYVVQRSWSNAAAAAGHDPCQPSSGTFFAASAVVPDQLSIPLGGGESYPTDGVKVPVGGTRTIDLELFSDAATDGPITVTAQDMASLYGSSPELELSLDRDHGLNGEKLHLHIKKIKAGGDLIPGGSAILVSAKVGAVTTTWPVYVGN